MSAPRVFRYRDGEELASRVAGRLGSLLTELQRQQEFIHLCLPGGPSGLAVCRHLAALAPSGLFDAARLHLWWSSDRFVGTTEPERVALKTLSLLAATMPLVPSHIHAMPPLTGSSDADDAAFAYAGELGDTVFDCCLLDVGEDGHIASIFPRHDSFAIQASTTLLASGVTNAPYEPADRITLNLPAINRSREVWLLAADANKREAVHAAVDGDPRCPASHAHGTDKTLWFVDEAAAQDLPYFHCDL
ncbi:6-phosphogluconolactonase [Propionibacterium sp.]|uniref:6-phosphogluconolactonase n=1 Tax=Propionibacterium sp. TaxID=1977903 RepID=UPI0039EB559A